MSGWLITFSVFTWKFDSFRSLRKLNFNGKFLRIVLQLILGTWTCHGRELGNVQFSRSQSRWKKTTGLTNWKTNLCTPLSTCRPSNSSAVCSFRKQFQAETSVEKILTMRWKILKRLHISFIPRMRCMWRIIRLFSCQPWNGIELCSNELENGKVIKLLKSGRFVRKIENVLIFRILSEFSS